MEWSWEFQLRPQVDGTTRLVSRNRVWVRRTIRAVMTMLAIEPAAFLMTRKMLLNIKGRAESMPMVQRRAA